MAKSVVIYPVLKKENQKDKDVVLSKNQVKTPMQAIFTKT